MDAQTITVGDFSPILGATAKGHPFTCMASVEGRVTVCGRKPENYLLSSDFFLNCSDCLAEMQYRHEHEEACRDPLGKIHITRKGE